jgi:flagellar biosynthesis/type III secretory pathway protein FliH
MTNWGWRAVEDGTGWLLASGVVGWVSQEEEASAKAIAEELLQLEARKSRLAEELVTAVASARAEALSSSRHEIERLLDVLAERPQEVARRTAMLAMLIAEAMLGRLAEREAAVLDVLLSRALEGLAGERELVVRAAPRIAGAVRERLGESSEGMAVRVDGSLSGADLVVEFARGQSDARLRSQLQLLQGLLEGCPDDLR